MAWAFLALSWCTCWETCKCSLGPSAVNAYAVFLKSKPVLLWGARLGLLILVFLHILTGVQLTLRNRAARPEKYDRNKPYKASYASRTLFLSGAALFAFIVYHLMHFTVGLVDPAYLQLRDAAVAMMFTG